jgi:hypothetical protein
MRAARRRRGSRTPRRSRRCARARPGVPCGRTVYGVFGGCPRLRNSPVALRIDLCRSLIGWWVSGRGRRSGAVAVQELHEPAQGVPARRRQGWCARQDLRDSGDDLLAKHAALPARHVVQPTSRPRPGRDRLREGVDRALCLAACAGVAALAPSTRPTTPTEESALGAELRRRRNEARVRPLMVLLRLEWERGASRVNVQPDRLPA